MTFQIQIRIQIRSLVYYALLSVVCILSIESDGVSSSFIQLQLHENKISTSNNSDYLRQIMRNAKSAEMLGYMQTDLNACDNFFDYSCGNWAKINPANNKEPRETNFYDLLSKTYHSRQLYLLQIAINQEERRREEYEDGKQETDAEIKVRQFYASCAHLAEKQSDLKQYRYQIRQIINEFGHMPALLPDGAFRANDFDWLATIASIYNRYGINIILQIGIRPDFENTTQNKIFIGEPALHLGTKSMYIGQATKWHRDEYRQEIQKQLQTHLAMAEERAAQTADEILDFEIKLAEGLSNHRLAKTLKSLAKLRSIEQLRTVYAPTLDLQKYLTIALGQAVNDSVYEYMLEYQENLVQMLKKTKPKEQLANYIFYQLIKPFFYELAEEPVAQEEHCLQKTKLFFAKVLDNTYYRKYLTESQEDEVNNLWTILKQTFKSELESDKLNWMTSMTRKLALEKLDAMKLEINSYAATNFNEEYANLQLDSVDYIANLKKLLNYRVKRTLSSLNEPPKPVEDALKFSFTPAYVAAENLIKIPVAMLQPNFLWSSQYPQALKFGTLGYLIAHELLHGFDDMGCNYDLEGRERNWWDANTTRAFNERKGCFKRQYSTFIYGDKFLPESDLQGENIADNGAVQIAYKAYENWLSAVKSKTSLRRETLPNMDYSGKQLFFISFAQFWCNDVNERIKDRVSLVDLHAPAMYRVIGSLANFNAFAKEFACKPGTIMNPEIRCQIY